MRKSEKKLKRRQRQLSKKFVKGKKPQSNNYHKARKRLGKCHLKVSRQRKDWSIKQARCVVASNDVVVYVDAERRAEGRPEDTKHGQKSSFGKVNI